MKCVAWCTNKILEGFEIVVNRTDPLNTNELLATCSLGKLVVGCHLEPIVIQDKNYFGSRVYYPYNYGSSCYCNDYQGSKCIALCALNINKYEIAQNYGRGMVRASCTRPENNLLGCGLFSMVKWRLHSGATLTPSMKQLVFALPTSTLSVMRSAEYLNDIFYYHCQL